MVVADGARLHSVGVIYVLREGIALSLGTRCTAGRAPTSTLAAGAFTAGAFAAGAFAAGAFTAGAFTAGALATGALATGALANGGAGPQRVGAANAGSIAAFTVFRVHCGIARVTGVDSRHARALADSRSSGCWIPAAARVTTNPGTAEARVAADARASAAGVASNSGAAQTWGATDAGTA
jgi:hypothetical protein